jgi:hypothetical protein
MSFDYTGLKNTATSLIDKFGADVSYISRDSGAYDPITGVGGVVETTTTTKAVYQTRNGLDRSEGKIAGADIFLVAGSSLAAEPKANDRIDNGKVWSIRNVMKESPSGEDILYTLEVEKV